MYPEEKQRLFYKESKDLLVKAIRIDQIESLRSNLKFHEWKYYVANDPIISDTEYDLLYKKLEKIEAEHPESHPRGELIKWALKSENEQRLKAMLNVAKAFRSISAFSDHFDNGLYYLNCQNGTLDLKAQELLPHDPQHMITKILPVTYDPKANSPEWEKFINEVTDDNDDIKKFLQVAIG